MSENVNAAFHLHQGVVVTVVLTPRDADRVISNLTSLWGSQQSGASRSLRFEDPEPPVDDGESRACALLRADFVEALLCDSTPSRAWRML